MQKHSKREYIIYSTNNDQINVCPQTKINPDPNLKSFTKLTRKDHIPICKIENPKISKNKNLYDLGFGDEFLDITPKA